MMQFSAIAGYQAFKDYLCRAVQRDVVPHAQLFHSAEGGAALPLALAFITYVHCKNQGADNPCMTCEGCKKMTKLAHPDVHYLFPLTAQKAKEEGSTTALALWRNCLTEQPYATLQDWASYLDNDPKNLQISKEQVRALHPVLGRKPFESTYKTILVWLPEHLHPSGANAMLKMVEEPSPHTLFIFISFAERAILPTLRSRLWPLYLPPFSYEELYATLRAHHPSYDPAQLPDIIKIAQGSVNQAEKLIAGHHTPYFASFSSWLRHAYTRHWSALVRAAEEFEEYGPQAEQNWIAYGLVLLSCTLRMQTGNPPQTGQLTEAERIFCEKLAGALSLEQLARVIQQLTTLQQELKRHAQPKLAFLAASLL